jgi:CDGSH-type Zn-finger protein
VSLPEPIVVTPIEGGPLKLENARDVHYCGEPVDTEATIWLCRCGESKNAPFCDGTHRTIGWQGTCEKAPTKDIVVWEGQRIRTRFNPTTCMHVFYCKPLKDLRETELASDGADGEAAARELARVVSTCPSGALSFELKTNLDVQIDTSAPAIDIVEGGEVRIKAAYTGIETMEGQAPDTATLCRCGRSRNKPFCDGRHKGRKNFR